MSFLKPYTTLFVGIILGAVVAPKALKMLHK